MTPIKRIFLLGIIVFSATNFVRAQNPNFNYSLSSDSVAWSELTSQTLCNTINTVWQNQYRIPIGFSFPFAGRTFDSLNIETNGYLQFDADNYYAFTAFHSFCDKIDSNGFHSVLSYQLAGASPNRILKIQYKNAGQVDEPLATLSYQIWLHENGSIEVRVGPNSYTDVALSDTTQLVRLGLLNKNMNTPVNSFFAAGNFRQATGHTQDENHLDAEYIHAVPFPGWRYVFVPVNN
jgi:hypothetical protein